MNNTSKDILLQYLKLFELTSFSLNKIVENNEHIKDHLINITTLFNECILLWHINIENILRYIINNYRSLQTIVSLIN